MERNFLTPTNVLFECAIINCSFKFCSSPVGFSRKKNVNRFFVSFVSGITEIYENVPQRT